MFVIDLTDDKGNVIGHEVKFRKPEQLMTEEEKKSAEADKKKIKKRFAIGGGVVAAAVAALFGYSAYRSKQGDSDSGELTADEQKLLSESDPIVEVEDSEVAD